MRKLATEEVILASCARFEVNWTAWNFVLGKFSLPAIMLHVLSAKQYLSTVSIAWSQNPEIEYMKDYCWAFSV